MAWLYSRSAQSARRNRSSKVARSAFQLESLEQRSMLAITAVNDGPFTTNEDTAIVVTAPTATTLVARQSAWSYLDEITNGANGTPTEGYPLDDANEADATPNVADAWNSPNFNIASSDATIGAWKQGNGVFGSGALATGVVIATQLLHNEAATVAGSTNTATTYLFRSTFTIPADLLASGPTFNWDALVDDGAIMYINGTEVARIRMPVAPAVIDTTTLGTASSSSENYGDRTVDFVLTSAQIAALMQPAPFANTIAVEFHQTGTTSSDTGFDMSLTATPGFGFGLTANDIVTNPAGPITVTVVTPPAHGTATVQNSGAYTYTPAANYFGPDSFVYQLSDGATTSNATVSIDVISVLEPPVAVADAYALNEGATLSATSPGVVAPTVVLPAGQTWDYLDTMTNTESYPLDDAAEIDATPGVADTWNSPNFNKDSAAAQTVGTWLNGSGLFGFGAIDCCPITTTLAGTAADTVTYLFRKSITLSADEANALNAAGLTLRFVVDDGAVFYFDGQEIGRYNMPTDAITSTTPSVGGGAEGTAGAGFPSSISLPAGTFTLTPGTHTLAVEVHQVNTGSSDIGFDVQIELPTPLAGVLRNDTNPEGGTLTAHIVPGQGVRHGALTFNPNGTFQYTPNANYFGTDAFYYYTSANGIDSAPVQVTFTITATPDAPTPANDSYSVENTQILDATIPTWDANRTHAGAVTLLPAGSMWSYSDDGTNQFTLHPNWNQPGFVPAAAGWLGPSPGVLGFGDAQTTLVTAGRLTYYFASTFNVANPAGIDALLLHLVRDDGAAVYINGTQVLLDNLPVDGHDQLGGYQTGTELGFHTSRVAIPNGLLHAGSNSIAVSVHQDNTNSSDISFDLAITVPPVASAVQFGVAANDTDPDQLAAFTLALVTPPAHHDGAFVLNANGTFVYDPVDSFTGIDSFVYSYTTASGTATATATIDVTGSSTCDFNADLNNNGTVDAADIAILAKNFGKTTGALPSQGDIDCDGSVNLLDLVVLQNFLTTAGSPAASAVVVSAPSTEAVQATASRAAVRLADRTPIAASRLQTRQLRATAGEATATGQPTTVATNSMSTAGLRASRSARSARAHSQAIVDLFG